MPDDTFTEAEARTLVIRLGKALLETGLPAHRLEDALQRLTHSLGLEGDFFATPTMLLFDLGPPGAERANALVRAQPGDIDLGRLGELHAVVGQVERRSLRVREAIARVGQIMGAPAPYPRWLGVLAYGLASIAGARLLNGSREDLIVSGAAGLVAGLLVATSKAVGPLARLVPAIAALATSFLSQSVARTGFGNEPLTVALAAVIILLPGYALTVAVTEVATGNLVSGSARLTGATTVFLQLGFGLAIGQTLAGRLPARIAEAAAQTQALPPWTLWLAAAVAALAFTVLMRARFRDAGWVLVVCLTAVATTRWAARWGSPAEASFVGAFAVGAVSHLFARLLDRPATLLLTPGTFLLVPGSVGFLSVSSLVANDVPGAVGLAFKTATVAMALTAGLLVAAFAVPPKRAL